MIATKLAVLMMTAMIIGVVGISVAAIPAAEAAIAIDQKGVKVEGAQIAQEAGHWGTVNYIDQEACTNEVEVAQPKQPEERDLSTGDQVANVEAGQNNECGEVAQSAEINNSLVDESTNTARPPEV